MIEEEKEKKRKILYNMNLKINFVNPRYWNNIPPLKYSDKNCQPIDSPDNFSIDLKKLFSKIINLASNRLKNFKSYTITNIS